MARAEHYEAAHVVSSAPVRELIAALKPTPLTLLHARELKYRDFLTVVLIGKSRAICRTIGSTSTIRR